MTGRRLDEPNALGEWPQRFLGERDLHRRQVEPPQLAPTTLREVEQRVAAAAAQRVGTVGRTAHEAANREWERYGIARFDDAFTAPPP